MEHINMNKVSQHEQSEYKVFQHEQSEYKVKKEENIK